MPKINAELVRHLGRLAKIKLTDEDIDQYQKEFGEIVSYVEQLQDINVDQLAATYQVTGLESITRADEIDQSGPDRKQLLANAPATKNGYIKVPRVID